LFPLSSGVLFIFKLPATEAFLLLKASRYDYLAFAEIEHKVAHGKRYVRRTAVFLTCFQAAESRAARRRKQSDSLANWSLIGSDVQEDPGLEGFTALIKH
jgi:hypothetical protein